MDEADGHAARSNRSVRDQGAAHSQTEVWRARQRRARTERAGHHELGFGETLAEHAHEGDRTAFAERSPRLAEHGERGIGESRIEPRFELGSVPAGAVVSVEELDMRAVRGVGGECLDHCVLRRSGVAGGRDAHAEAERGLWA